MSRTPTRRRDPVTVALVAVVLAVPTLAVAGVIHMEDPGAPEVVPATTTTLRGMP